MGTSNSYGGPGANKPLLPPWANEPIQPLEPIEGQPPIQNEDQSPDQHQPENGEGETSGTQDASTEQLIRPIQALSSARSLISRYANSGGEGYFSSGLRSHTHSIGGASGATKSARSGRKATQKLGAYLSNISTHGIVNASEELGIPNILGKPVKVALSQIVDKLSPDSSTLEDVITRRAIVKTIEELYDKYSIEEQGLEALNSLDEAGIEDAIISSTINFIYVRFLLDLADRFENSTISEMTAIHLEKEMKEYIQTEVKRNSYDETGFKGVDWFGKEGKDLTEKIYQQAYEILEVSK